MEDNHTSITNTQITTEKDACESEKRDIVTLSGRTSKRRKKGVRYIAKRWWATLRSAFFRITSA